LRIVGSIAAIGAQVALHAAGTAADGVDIARVRGLADSGDQTRWGSSHDLRGEGEERESGAKFGEHVEGLVGI
jgi:hypothetical protein